jgi:hypothetical protein
MDDAMAPAWIRELKAKQLEGIRSQRETALAESLIFSEAPKQWEEFIRELRIQVEGCRCLLGFGACFLHDISQKNPPEKIYRALINGRGPFASVSFTDVHFRQLKPDPPYIECLRDSFNHGKDYPILFRVTLSGGVCLLLPTGDQVDPEKAAEYVVSSMVREMGVS